MKNLEILMWRIAKVDWAKSVILRVKGQMESCFMFLDSCEISDKFSKSAIIVLKTDPSSNVPPLYIEEFNITPIGWIWLSDDGPREEEWV